jgi:beta-glucosidase
MDLIDSLVANMSLAEKIGQLNMVTAGQAITGPVSGGELRENLRAGNIGSILNLWGREATSALQKIAVEETRLAIPLLFGLDVLHGHKTIFPIPLAEAAAFDPILWKRTARAAAMEAAEDGVALTFAPMLDIARDPRWGRMAEGPGEDPFVAAKFAEAKIRGFQGANLSAASSIAATAKHFCGGGAAQAGREYGPVDVSERTLHEVYLPPFRAAVGAGCAAIMAAFNNVAGIPMIAHTGLLRDYLRSKLGFDGVIISDYNAIAELIQHGVAADLVEAAALALKASVDIDLVSGAYASCLPIALARGLVELQHIDAAARRVLRLKQKLGLFDDPYRRVSTTEFSAQAMAELATDAARRSITLLANRDILPLPANSRRIAVIGPLADAPAEMRGPWALVGNAENCVTPLAGLRTALPQCEIVFAAGVDADSDDGSGIAAACALSADANVIVLCLGERADMSGEATSRATPGLPGRQRELAESVLATGAPVVVILFSGRPLMITWLVERARAVVGAWFLGDMAGQAIADVLTGRFSPTARLPISWPRETGQIPIFYSSRPTGRPADAADPFTSKYLDLSVDPLFPFGHGLSFSRVGLKNLRLNRAEFRVQDWIKVEVDASNEGNVATEETIFLFVHDLVSATARPLMELKAWAKVELDPGQSKVVAFNLPAESFRVLDQNLESVLEPGDFHILVGLNADQKSLLKASLRALAG